MTPLPSEMRDDTAFMDRLHAYVPGWDFPKLNPNQHFTNHFGLVSDLLSECWSRLRTGSRVSVLQGRVNYGGALSGRDITAVNKTVSGLLKLPVPGSGDAGAGRRSGGDGTRCPGSPAAGSKSSRSGCSRANFAIRISAMRWAKTASRSSSPRRNCTTTRRSSPILCRRVRRGASVPARPKPVRVCTGLKSPSAGVAV